MSNVHVIERFGFNSLDNSPVDRQNNVIKGVKLLGWESRNNAKYSKEAFTKHANMYDGAAINLNHMDRNKRTIDSRFGRVNGVEARDDGLYAKQIKYNPRLPLTESILWFIENDPKALGMSHDALVKMEQQPDGSKYYTEPVTVHSVDFVTDPATTKGVFENMNPDGTLGTAPGDGTGEGDPIEMFKAKLGEALQLGATTLQPDQFKSVVKHLVNAHGELGDGESTGNSGDGDGEATKQKNAYESLKKELDSAKLRLGAFEVKEKFLEKKVVAKTLCEQAGLPKHAVTERVLESLAKKLIDNDEAGAKADVMDLKSIVSVREQAPRSAGQDTGKPVGLDGFVKYLQTGGF
jgi:hypothetical protein